jgi:hypothetical protein
MTILTHQMASTVLIMFYVVTRTMMNENPRASAIPCTAFVTNSFSVGMNDQAWEPYFKFLRPSGALVLAVLTNASNLS